jgi:hypothetical protein
MPSPLDFPSTATFRNALIARNLTPYSVPGVYSPPLGPRLYEVIQRDLSVVDSDDTLILNDPFADLLYPLNAYGPLGGYNKNINVGGLANTKSNLGPYDYTDAQLLQNSENYKKDAFGQNIFNPSPNTTTFTVGNTLQPKTGNTVKFYSSYGVPQAFIASSYSPYQILLQDDPQGDNGRLSEDSYLARLGATTLRNEFRERIAREIRQNTVGRINLPNAISDPFEALQILQGKRPLIERDWVITRPDNIALRAADFAARLSGTYYPSSVIPGEYFQFSEQNLSLYGQISFAFNNGKSPVGGILGKVMGLLSKEKNPSQLFLDNTGGGQKSQLFYLLDYNRFTPQYERGSGLGIIDNVREYFRNLLDRPSEGGYYVGSKQAEPSMIGSPAGELPINPLGHEVQSPVYGPDVLSKLYEGEQNFKFGFNGKALNDGGGIDGGFIWTSPKYNNPGFKATVGGDQGPEDAEYNLIRPKIETSDSQLYDFRQGSILDITQRLVDSTPDGSKRLSHVGNAINQLSKVFNDGYKEITKGSKVLTYENPSKGVHTSNNVYCRVFTKDTPYYTYADLQKTDGNIRKFTYSILDNTYNLNIAPLRNPGSTNIVDNKVKKYMFSLENLAWRTSNRPGFTYDDLPICERGPNGGRVMWFPPYDLSFSETITPGFQDTNFLGRVEPIYTYKDTKRTGSLSWKIVVDHPSILNTIVNKELKNEITVERINSIVDSFFAGCLKYDIYELAKRWNTLPPSELFYLQTIRTNPNANIEDIDSAIKNANSVKVTKEGKSDNDSTSLTKSDNKTNNVSTFDGSKYINLGFYFDNDIPDPRTRRTTSTVNYLTTYQTYTSPPNISLYYKEARENAEAVNNFFDNVVKNNFNYINNDLLNDIENYFNSFKSAESENNKPSLTITLEGSASAPNTIDYNVPLSQRRIDSVKQYFQNARGGVLKQYIDNKQLIFNGIASGETAFSIPTYIENGKQTSKGNYNCTDQDTRLFSYNKIYSVDAMACRRVVIKEVKALEPQPQEPKQDNTNTDKEQTNNPSQPITPKRPIITTQQKLREGISKKILRSILSECDYFDLIKESNPMFYDSMKEKIKYFTPAFHAITPEGLNSRLTFLQQCSRPGDTIPIIGVDGKPKYENSINTAFGAPPVLVLRVGDFFHTKIIPTNIQIQYEPLMLDINPEGIGVQPMLAKITLGFNFIGGEGLKEPIDKLQNALSFNYYANTEMYDERADFTDESFIPFDKDIESFLIPPVIPTNKIENSGGDTIGTILTQETNDLGISGTTSYEKIMDAYLANGQTYMNTVYGKFGQIVSDYNLPMVNVFTDSMLYSTGNILEFTTPQTLDIVGKSDKYETTVASLFDKVIQDIENVNSKNDDNGYGLIKFLYENNIKKTLIKQLKTNLINQIKQVKEGVITNLTAVNNELVTAQQNLINTITKLNFIGTKTDGYINVSQEIITYNLTATTATTTGSSYNNTFDELVGNYTGATDILNQYNTLYKDNKLIGQKFNLNDISIETANTERLLLGCNPCEKRFYVAMGNIIINENSYQIFKNTVLPKELIEQNGGDDLEKKFNEFFSGRKIIYRAQYEDEQKYFKDKITQPYDIKFKTWTPYKAGQKRIFEFSNYIPSTDEQKTRLSNIYKDGNSNLDTKVFNGKNKLN